MVKIKFSSGKRCEGVIRCLHAESIVLVQHSLDGSEMSYSDERRT